MTHNYKFQSVTLLYMSGTADHIMKNVGTHV